MENTYQTKEIAYTSWINRLNEIKNSESTGNGYVDAHTFNDHYLIDDNGSLELFYWDGNMQQNTYKFSIDDMLLPSIDINSNEYNFDVVPRDYFGDWCRDCANQRPTKDAAKKCTECKVYQPTGYKQVKK
jgi:hypothetical protein